MSLDRIVFWIRLLAWATLDFVNGLDDGPGEGEETVGDVAPWFKPERIQVWLGILAQAALKAVDEVGTPPPDRPEVDSGAFRNGLWPSFKPERIQFWLELLARFVLAVVETAPAGEETGKSGEPGSGAPDPRKADW